MRLILSSSNKDKIKEIKKIIGHNHELLLKSDLDLEDFDVKETGKTLRENAYIKAKALFDLTHENVIADDTGLFVEALGGKPGVFTARFAGENATYDDNNEKMLKELSHLENLNDRRAYFMTIICLITRDGKVHYVEGKLDGFISPEKEGIINLDIIQYSL